MIVMKFGGSSVESAAAIGRVASIVKARAELQPVVVVSAMGKTTNKLLAIGDRAVAGQLDSALADLAVLRAFHLQESGGLEAVGPHFDQLADLIRGLAAMGELTPRATDALSAYGERLSSLIVAEQFRRAGIDAIQVDARNLNVTDKRHKIGRAHV